jgi:hypothetical protein
MPPIQIDDLATKDCTLLDWQVRVASLVLARADLVHLRALYKFR